MNWQALQALGDLTGAVGVIVSLLYVAAQIRQNTKTMQSAANQDLLTSFRGISEYSTLSPFGARLWYATLRGDWDSMTAEEQAAGRNFMIAGFRVWDHAYMQHKAGLLGDDAWNGWAYQIRLTSALKGFRDVWPNLRPMLSPPFARWVDDLGDDATQVRAEYARRLTEAGLDASMVTDEAPPVSPNL